MFGGLWCLHHYVAITTFTKLTHIVILVKYRRILLLGYRCGASIPVMVNEKLSMLTCSRIHAIFNTHLTWPVCIIHYFWIINKQTEVQFLSCVAKYVSTYSITIIKGGCFIWIIMFLNNWFFGLSYRSHVKIVRKI